MEKLTKSRWWKWAIGAEGPTAREIKCGCEGEASRRLFGILESVLLWENSVNSISVVVVFNILFWGIVVLEIRAFAAASSAALVVIFCYSTLEAQVDKERAASGSPITHPQSEKVHKIINKVKLTCNSLRALRQDQPGVFCAGVCTASLVFWLIGRAVNGVLITYTLCMSILVGPVLLLRIPSKIFPTKGNLIISRKNALTFFHEIRRFLERLIITGNVQILEWDNEIEEFLPAVTEDNLEVLERAGEDGDHSPTPLSESKTQNDPFNDDELIGLKMPSHEDGSTDGLELSELELSCEADANPVDIKIQTSHFDGTSSSEDEVDLELRNQETSPSDSESEFEIIDSQEISGFHHKS